MKSKLLIVLFILIGYYVVFEVLFKTDSFPFLNNIFKNYLILGILIFAFPLYFLLKKYLLDSLISKIIFFIGIILCSLTFHLRHHLFGNFYIENDVVVLCGKGKIYKSFQSTHYRIYKRKIFNCETIDKIKTKNAKKIELDRMVGLEIEKKGLIDTIWICLK